jgi:perosamine synthetase
MTGGLPMDMGKPENAKFGADAFKDFNTKLPGLFPRIIGPNAMKYLQEVVDSGLASDMTTRFEKTFAKEYGVKHCIATPGCTPALHVLAATFGFEPGDEIIVSPVTDYGTVLGLLYENYIPVFADTEEGSVNVSAETIEKCITERTRAVLVVHKTGIICDMDPILRLAEKHRLIVYEDVCQAVFGKYKGRLAGTFGKAAAFSFDAEKTLGSDTGGCIITNDDEIADRARYIGHSRDAKTVPGFGRVHQDQGLAYRMPSCTAAMTLAQLEIIKPAVEKIDRMARYLTSLIRNIDGILPLEIPDYVDLYSCWMFGFRIDPEKFLCTPEEFVKRLADEGIGDAGLGKYYLMPESLKFLQRKAEKKIYPFSKPPASFDYVYDENTCPNAHRFLKTFIRWSSFSEKYEKEHCELAASIIEKVARANRK